MPRKNIARWLGDGERSGRSRKPAMWLPVLGWVKRRGWSKEESWLRYRCGFVLTDVLSWRAGRQAGAQARSSSLLLHLDPPRDPLSTLLPLKSPTSSPILYLA